MKQELQHLKENNDVNPKDTQRQYSTKKNLIQRQNLRPFTKKRFQQASYSSSNSFPKNSGTPKKSQKYFLINQGKT
jgi:hypothetical protein